MGSPTGVIRPRVKEKNLAQARTLAKRNGGKLPNPWKMIQQGYGGLYRYMLRHPKFFEEFEVESAVGQEKVGRNNITFNVAIRQEHIATAMELKRRLGHMPDEKWLAKKGYTRLAAYQRVRPEVFAKLPDPKKNGKAKPAKKRKT